jgi:hypothetical protein
VWKDNINNRKMPYLDTPLTYNMDFSQQKNMKWKRGRQQYVKKRYRHLCAMNNGDVSNNLLMPPMRTIKVCYENMHDMKIQYIKGIKRNMRKVPNKGLLCILKFYCQILKRS